MNAKRVLVAYGSKAGATAGIAEEIGKALKPGAREHTTFGGAMTAETSDPVARHMVSRGRGGDFRNPERIRAWAHHIGTELDAAPLTGAAEP